MDGGSVAILQRKLWFAGIEAALTPEIITSNKLGRAPPPGKPFALKLETEKRAIPYKETPTTEEAWDGPRVIASIPADLSVEELSQFYAYQIADANPEAKSSYKLPHHENDDGSAGAANVRALTAAVAALNGARGGVDIPDADRQAVYDHLKSHMDDAGLETPELKKKKPKRTRRYEDPITQQKIDQSDQDNRQIADLGADPESADLTDVQAIYNRIEIAKVRNKLIKFKRKEKNYGNK